MLCVQLCLKKKVKRDFVKDMGVFLKSKTTKLMYTITLPASIKLYTIILKIRNIIWSHSWKILMLMY